MTDRTFRAPWLAIAEPAAISRRITEVAERIDPGLDPDDGFWHDLARGFL